MTFSLVEGEKSISSPTESVNDKGHLISIVNMRGLASLAVALFHLIHTENFLEEVAWLKDVAAYGAYGVQFFFIISGFVIPYSLYKARYSISDYGRFILKRLVRLDPPYIVSICIIVGVYGLLAVFMHAPFPYTLKQLLLHLGYLNAFLGESWINVVYWSLSVEFQYYLIVGLIFPLLLGNAITRRITMILLGAISLVSQSLDREFFFVHTPIFCLGISSFLWYIKKIESVEFYVTCLLALVLIGYTAGGVVVFVSFLAVLLLFTFQYKSKILNFLGEISYSMYLNHIIVGSILLSMTKKRTQVLGLELVGLAISIIASLVVAYVLYRLAEKPFQKLSSSIKYSGK